jgi:hypothetical protein
VARSQDPWKRSRIAREDATLPPPRRRAEVRAALKIAIGVLLALVVPGIACICYYAIVDLGAPRAAWAPWVGLSYPGALIGAVALAASLLAPRRRPWVVRASALALVACGALLLVAESHSFGF